MGVHVYAGIYVPAQIGNSQYVCIQYGAVNEHIQEAIDRVEVTINQRIYTISCLTTVTSQFSHLIPTGSHGI
jgi:hypothetical protein